LTGYVVQNRILVTGGAGQLAKELLKLDRDLLAPSRNEMDVSSYDSIESYCAKGGVSVVIHAGAVTNKFNEDADEGYLLSNIIGTANVALWCRRHHARLVYISSDYVYPGERGDYSEESPVLPVNRYAASKLGGECSVLLVANSLIVRTSFYRELNFAQGCTDQYTSRMPIGEAAEAIYRLALREDVAGVINVGRPVPRSIFDIVKSEFNPDVRPVRRRDIAITYALPHDSSMDTTRFNNLMTEGTTASKIQSQCRICGSVTLDRYLDLGSTPLANSYVTRTDLSSPEFREELALQVCTRCGLSQLTRVVHPDLMFKNYLYVSSTTATFRKHCEELARTSCRVAGAKPGDMVMDIASNDGCLLSKFQDIGMRVVGIDPAENLATEANAAGIRTLNVYWSPSIAKDVTARFGDPVVITATNVFAHVDDVHKFVEGVASCLARRGIFVIECPYVLDFIGKNEFDTAYHEHLSYIGITPLVTLMRMHEMDVFDVEYFADLHGGTIRTYVCRRGEHERTPRVAEYLERETAFGITAREPYRAFAERVLLNKRQLRELIDREVAGGKVIWAYGASAKGNTLVNFFEISDRDVPVAIDDNPKKRGYFTPGAHMRIAGIQELAGTRVDYLLLLAWNFQKEIIARCQAVQYAGGFILPVPVPTIIPDTSAGAPRK
jgi:dTDP-4-dehydrorhamnose reductase/SAM-dependent methyltransferase